MCKVCDKKVNKLCGTNDDELRGLSLFMKTGSPALYVSGWCYGSVGIEGVGVNINYCPFCGKKLRKVNI